MRLTAREGDLYCRTPQDSSFNVRGARNIPCETVPGKRAPTVAMCESDEQYVPLNDGVNWKGDPNATLSGQPIPQLPPEQAPAEAPAPGCRPLRRRRWLWRNTTRPPVAMWGPTGVHYTQADLARGACAGKSWQSMLLPTG